MGVHPLVLQLHFVRQKWQLGLDGVTAEEAVRRFEPMNSISWMVGHLASHEQTCWLTWAQGHTPHPQVNACAPGQPASVPAWENVLPAWKAIVEASEDYLDALTQADMQTFLEHDGHIYREDVGTMLLRLTYHYWFHLGEMQAVRQLLGHKNLPPFVGDMSGFNYLSGVL